MNRMLLFGIFGFAAAAQLVIPASMIASRERTLRTGEVFKFRTAPVDPFDAFRGRYVAVNIESNWVAAPSTKLRHGQPVCVGLAAGPDGFAHFTTCSLEPPATGAWLRMKVQYYQSGNNVNLEQPFDRFYMEESDAPRAEQVYRNAARRDGPRDAWLVVRVRNGKGVVENLMIDGRPVKDVLKDAPNADK